MKSNHERLTTNQEETRQNVAIFLDGERPPSPSPEQLLDNAQLALNESKAKGVINYGKVIELLEERRDAQQGITWHRMEHSDGTKDLIRDSSKAKTDPPPMDSPDSYAIQFLNETRAAEKLLDLELSRIMDAAGQEKLTPQDLKTAINRVNDAKDKLQKEAVEVLDQVGGEKFNIKKKNFALVKILTEAGIDKPEKKLATAKDFGNLSDQQYHVTTITSQLDSAGKERYVIESDNMLLGLTDIQKAQYKAIAASSRGSNVELTIGTHQIDMSWYNNLSPDSKDLVRENAAEIAKGNMVLPTQLRGELIGLRNAFSKSTYVTAPTDEKLARREGIKMVSRTLHAGTPSFHGKGLDTAQKQEVANENLTQLESFVEPGKRTTVNVLNSPANPTGIDSAIHAQVGEGQGKLGGERATTPLNAFRMFSGNDNSGYNKALNEVAKVTKYLGGLDAVTTFLTTGKGEAAAREQLEKYNTSGIKELDDLKKTFEHAINAKHYIVTSHALRDPNNSNLQLSSEMKLVGFSANHGAIKSYVDKTVALQGNVNLEEIVTICASGKDRTGLTETDTTRKAVNDELGFKGTEPQAIENLKAQVKGGHTQVMASLNGGTKGAHGIKSDTLPAFPKEPYKDHITGLQQGTASFNKFKYKDPDEPSRATKILKGIGTVLAYVTILPIVAYKIGQATGLIEKPKKFEKLNPIKAGEPEVEHYKAKTVPVKETVVEREPSELLKKLQSGKEGQHVENAKVKNSGGRSTTL